jgi:hypothetical protein
MVWCVVLPGFAEVRVNQRPDKRCLHALV